MRGDGWYNFAGMKCRRHFQKTFQWRVLRPENSKNENGKGRAILGWTRNRHTRERIYEKCRMTDLKQKKKCGRRGSENGLDERKVKSQTTSTKNIKNLVIEND